MRTATTVDEISPQHDSNGGKRHAQLGAIVTGADYRALGVVRSLGRRGIPVWVVKSSDHGIAAHSRYATRILRAPAKDGEPRLRFFLDLSKEHGLQNWVLFPTDDEAVSLISQFHEEFSQSFQVATPPWESLQWAVNKVLMHRLATRLNIAQPWTVCPADVDEVSSLDCPFPVILKPAVKDVSNFLTTAKAWRVEDREALVRAYREAVKVMPADLLMVQEVIPGGGECQFSYTTLSRDGKSLAYLTAKRRRQFPMDFGRASTFVETINEPALIEPSLRLIDAIKLSGLAEIEYKRDPRDGSFKLLDINPRIWGWQSLCGRAGVNYPYLMWLMLNGRPVPPAEARAGVRWIRLSSDIPYALKGIVGGKVSPVEYVRSLLGGPIEEAVMAADDPMPGLMEFPLLADTIVKRLVSRRKI